MDFREILKNRFVILDGAMGTMLQQEDLRAGELPESYNIEKPEIVYGIHKKYIEAGADIILTNTAGANELKLDSSPFTVKQAIEAGVKIARQAAGEKLVALDIGPIGQMLEPLGTLSFERAYEIFKRQVEIGSSAGADIILFETISDIYEMKAGVLAAKENCDLPIFATMTFQEDGRTLMGTDPMTMVFVLEALGVDVLGVNCSLGPGELQPIVDEILKYSSIPVMVKPNAGLPHYEEGKTIYDVSVEIFSREIYDMAEKGVAIFGGCCGTNPDYIKDITRVLSGLKPVEIKKKNYTAVCSSTKTELIDDKIQIVGERINPTGKKKLKQALIDADMGYILNEAIAQQKLGADILDINAGIPEIDEATTMVKMVKEIQGIVDLPLQIDSSNPEVLEKAVRVCNGKPIINSVNGEKEVMDRIFPIAKKYGAVVVGLTMDEKGIPKTFEGRVKICEKILKTAESYGIDKNNIIIDCLALTVSAEQEQAFETLKAIRAVKEKYGVRTILGVSNISYGLPERELLNRTYLTMALTHGLNMPILDPRDSQMLDIVRSFRVLANIDKGAEDFISCKSINTIRTVKQEAADEKNIRDVILDGLKGEAAHHTKELLKTKEPMEIVNSYIIPALDEAGEKYEKGEFFLPQLIQSAETVKKSFKVLKEALKESEQKINKGKIILATVKGDIHDIGKNIVKVMLENYGYEVIDLGKDVPSETIVNQILKHDVKLVGLSALMTTTVANMARTIETIKKTGLHTYIMVGGAVLNEEYAKMIGADCYGKDAREAVKIAEMYFQDDF